MHRDRQCCRLLANLFPATPWRPDNLFLLPRFTRDMRVATHECQHGMRYSLRLGIAVHSVAEPILVQRFHQQHACSGDSVRGWRTLFSRLAVWHSRCHFATINQRTARRHPELCESRAYSVLVQCERVGAQQCLNSVCELRAFCWFGSDIVGYCCGLNLDGLRFIMTYSLSSLTAIGQVRLAT